jgi:hypothetical protein
MVQTYDLSARIIFVHSQTRGTIPLTNEVIEPMSVHQSVRPLAVYIFIYTYIYIYYSVGVREYARVSDAEWSLVPIKSEDNICKVATFHA